MRTRALILSSPGTVAIEEIALPDPRPIDVVVKTQLSGISIGTERWAYLGKRPELKFPNVLGYIGIGTVIEVGVEAAKRGWKAGMGINFNHSRLPDPFAGNSWMGGHVAEAVVDVLADTDIPRGGTSWFRSAPMPEGLAPEDAVLTPLCGVSLRGIEMAVIPAGSTVLVVGAGVIGQFCAQVCRLKGAKAMVSDVVQARLDIAAKNGAEWTVNSKIEKLEARAKAIAPEGFDVIIDTASIPAVVNQVIPLLALKGQFIFQGWYPPPSGLDLNAFHTRLPTCFFPCGHGAPHVSTAMRWARDGRIQSRNLLSKVIRPDGAQEFYRHMADSSEAFLGAAIDWRKP